MPTAETLRTAVDDGVMFAHPVVRDHDEWVASARAAAAAVRVDEVSTAFVDSLTSRRLDLRSALGSYAVARRLPEHSFEPGRQAYLCRVCGLTDGKREVDLNVLSFERFKWGGVRHDHVEYIAFDLEQFRRAPRGPVQASAVALGREVLAALRGMAPRESATMSLPRLRMVKGNQQERAVVVDVLGLCGVMGTSQHPGFLDKFVPFDERDLPAHHDVERAYPACWWHGSDGLDPRAVSTFLPSLA